VNTAPDLPTAVDWAKAGTPCMVRCPAHDDGQASLSVGPGTDQPVVFYCHAGCQPPEIMAAAGITWEEVCAPRDECTSEEWTPSGTASHVYTYTDEHGEMLFQALRTPVAGGKTFSQRHPDPTKQHGWAWNLQGVRRVLYHLPEVVAAVEDGTEVWVLEGEKDVERARSDGKVATCSPMGAGKWRTEYGASLAGARVTIVADADKPGREHAEEVFTDLVENHGCTVRIFESTIGNDYTDHRQHGGTDEMFIMTKASFQPTVDVGGLGIQTFIESDFPTGAEIIPGMLAEAEVVVFVGPEGHGKSTFLRQMAVQCAAGLVPLTGGTMEPLRCMYIDAEVPERQQQTDWSRLAGLAARHTGERVPDDRLMLFSEWRNEPDLITPDGAAWLHERISALRPQIVFMGPVQNLVGRDTKDDEVVRRFKHAINSARSICGTAFLIEHHAPHRAPGDKERQMRPYGSSLFMKWPDYGYGLKPTEEESVYDLYPFRRPRVRSRAWPERVRWGKPNTMEFPWEIAPPEDGGTVLGHPRWGT
jgi:hypothetical protein